jgi:hypothetical protein
MASSAPLPLLSYTPQPKDGWVAYSSVAGTTEFRDLPISLLSALRRAKVQLCSGALIVVSMPVLVWALIPFESPWQLLPLFFVLFGLFGLGMLCRQTWVVAHCPGLLRIDGETFSVDRDTRAHSRALRDIASITSVHDEYLYISACSILIRFRDGTRVSVLYCKNRHESRWIVQMLRHAIGLAEQHSLPI